MILIQGDGSLVVVVIHSTIVVQLVQTEWRQLVLYSYREEDMEMEDRRSGGQRKLKMSNFVGKSPILCLSSQSVLVQTQIQEQNRVLELNGHVESLNINTDVMIVIMLETSPVISNGDRDRDRPDRQTARLGQMCQNEDPGTRDAYVLPQSQMVFRLKVRERLEQDYCMIQNPIQNPGTDIQNERQTILIKRIIHRCRQFGG